MTLRIYPSLESLKACAFVDENHALVVTDLYGENPIGTVKSLICFFVNNLYFKLTDFDTRSLERLQEFTFST